MSEVPLYDIFLGKTEDDSPHTVTSKLSTGVSKSLYQHVREPVCFSKELFVP